MSKFEREQQFEYPEVLIAGYGIVGKHLKEEFPFAVTYDPDRDQNAAYSRPPLSEFEFCFIAVPTPNKDGKCDTSIVEEAIKSVNAQIYIIKSTVPPDTTKELIKKYDKKIIFSPEYYGNTQFALKPNFVILGGDEDTCHKVRQLYELTKSATFKFFQCRSTEAEIIKYMENSFLAMKVIFCNQFKDIADLYGVNYDKVRDGFVLDERVGESHTFVFDDYRGYDSKCLNKDIPAIIAAVKEKGYNNFIMEKVEEINNNFKKSTN